MVLALPVLVGVLLAALCGGDLRRLAALELRSVWLFYLAIGIQVVAFPARFLPWHTSDEAGRVLWLASYAVLWVAAVRNVRLAGVPVVAAGMLANVAAVLANGGHMPALPEALRAAGKTPGVHFNSAADATPRLSWIVDRWAAPGWLPWANVYSVGDVLIAVGVLVVVVAACAPRSRSARTGGSLPSTAEEHG
jgi:uncharacterized protein DUF5317